MSKIVELGIRRYKSLPSKLNNLGEIDIESHNPMIVRTQSELNKTLNISNPGITNDCGNCLKKIQSYLDKSETFTFVKNTIKEKFPYVLHYYTHVLFIIVFEIIFYFQYAVVIEKQMINNMVEDIVYKFADLYFTYVPEARQYANQLTEQIVEDVCDKYVSKDDVQNEKIYERCLLFVIGLLIFFCIVVLTGTKFYGYKKVLGTIFDSMILIFLLGIFEYCFFTFVILCYKIISTGDIICTAIKALYTYINK